MTILFKITGVKKLFDLSSGYLGDDHIGTYDGEIHVYSAEAFLNEVDAILTRASRSSYSIQVTRVIVPDEKIWYRPGMR